MINLKYRIKDLTLPLFLVKAIVKLLVFVFGKHTVLSCVGHRMGIFDHPPIRNTVSYTKKMILSLFIVLSIQGHSQQPGFKHLTINDGLPSSTIYSIFQDSQGYIWFASDIGVSRYDGYSFTRYTVADGLADNEIFDLYEDSKGRIWFLSYNGRISYYFKGRIYNSENTPVLSGITAQSYITSIQEEPATGYIWISSYWGELFNLSPEGRCARFSFRNEFGSITKFCFSDSSSISVLGSKSIYELRFNAKRTAIKDTIDQHIKLYSASSNPKGVIATGEIFFSNGGNQSFVYRYNFLTKEIRTIFTETYSVSVTNIGSYGDYIWISTRQGFMLFNRKTKHFSAKILRDYVISSVLLDREGNLWVATLGEGVFYQSQNGIYSFPLEAQSVSCLSKDNQGNVWMGNLTGEIRKVSGDRHQKISLTDKRLIADHQIYSISFPGNKILVGSAFGFWGIGNSQKEFYGGITKQVFEYSDGSIWLIYGKNLLLRIDKEAYARRRKLVRMVKSEEYYRELIAGGSKYHSDALLDKRVNSMWKGPGAELWVATDENLYRINLDLCIEDRNISIDPKIRVHDIRGLPDGNLVLATTGGGIEVISSDGNSLGKVGQEHGLSSNFCTSLEVDDQGTIWVGTNKGLNRVAGFPDSTHVISLDENDGFPDSEIVDLVFNCDTLWVATKKGLSFLSTNMITSKASNSSVYINEFAVNGDSYMKDGNYIDNSFLKYFQNDISISFVYLSFASHKKILYRYKLFQYDEWKYTQDTHLNFPALSPALYQFQIEAKDKSGKWSQATVINFEIAKPFWNTIFFNVILFGISVSLVWGVTSYYFNRQRQKVIEENKLIMSEIRALRAQINPHFFFNVLNAIQGMMFKNDLETMHSYLGKFGKLVRQMLDHSDKNFISLQDEIASMTNYLQLEQLRMKNKFTFSFEVAPDLDTKNVEIPIMMLQPFVENSIKHGFQHKNGAGKLIIRFEQHLDCLLVSIIDDGIGRERAKEFKVSSHESKGTDLIMRRIDILNYKKRKRMELTIKDHPNDTGTSVVLKMPLE